MIVSMLLGQLCVATDPMAERRQARLREIQLEERFRLDQSIDATVLAKQVQSEFEAHADLLGGLDQRDIVVLLGNTGAGKSTLANFLAYGTGSDTCRMAVTSDGELVLKDPNDTEAMAIGCGGESETIYPKTVKVGDLWLYDLPGLNDTKGTVRNLMNAAFIRQILTKAKSVRLVIVAGQDELTASRGHEFKRMLDSVKKLFKIDQASARDILQGHSVLVLMKSTHKVLKDSVEYVKKKSEAESLPLLNIWLDHGRFGHMCHAQTEGANWEGERQAIYDQIVSSRQAYFQEGSGQNFVDISAIYPIETVRVLEKMFFALMQQRFEAYAASVLGLSQLDEAIEDVRSRNSRNSGNSNSGWAGQLASSNPFANAHMATSVQAQRKTVWHQIDEEISGLEQVRLLKGFCEGPYVEARRRFETEMVTRLASKKEARVRELDLHCVQQIERGIDSYHQSKGNSNPVSRIAAALNHEFHQSVYSAVFDETTLGQLTRGDRKEQEILRKRLETFMQEYRQKQIQAYTEFFDRARSYATGLGAASANSTTVFK